VYVERLVYSESRDILLRHTQFAWSCGESVVTSESNEGLSSGVWKCNNVWSMVT